MPRSLRGALAEVAKRATPDMTAQGVRMTRRACDLLKIEI